MKRFWIGVGILVVLLGVSIGINLAVSRIYDDIHHQLDRAGEAALAENWDRADECIHLAREKWRKYWHFSASLHDHEPMDEGDRLFAELKVFRRQKETLHYAATCANLSELVLALSEGARFNWWNLLSSPLPMPQWPGPEY